MLLPVAITASKLSKPCLVNSIRDSNSGSTATKYFNKNGIINWSFDDVLETFLMNLFDEGRIGCFPPVTWLTRKEITVIRPLVYCKEDEVLKIVAHEHIPVVKSKCPADKHTEREHVKNLISKLEREEGYENLDSKLMGALQRSRICGWGLMRGSFVQSVL